MYSTIKTIDFKSNEPDGTKRNFIYPRNNIRSQNLIISLVQVNFVLFSILEARNWSLLYSSWSKRLLDPILRGSHQFRKGAIGTRLSPMVTAKIYYIPKNWLPQTNVYILTHDKDCLSQRTKKVRVLWQLSFFVFATQVSVYSSYFLQTFIYFINWRDIYMKSL